MNLQALKTFITGPGAAIQFANPFSGESKTVAAWAAQGSIEQVHQALNDAGIGAALGKTAARDSVSPGEIWTRLMTSDGWATVAGGVKDDIARVVRENPFPIGDPEYSGAVEAAITGAYPALLAAWNGLKLRQASVAEADFPGVTETDIVAALALP